MENSKAKYRYRIETRKPGTYLRPQSFVSDIEWAVKIAVQHQSELPGGKTVIHDMLTDTYVEWNQTKGSQL